VLRTEEDFTQSSVVSWLKVVKKDLPKRFTELRWSDRSNSNQFQPLWLVASNLIMLHLHAIVASSPYQERQRAEGKRQKGFIPTHECPNRLATTRM
jgi:hypothetical protein